MSDVPLTSDAPATRRAVPHHGGVANDAVAALEAQFGGAVLRHAVMWGETTVWVRADQVHDIIAWLHDEPSQQYDYLVDLTAVEYRDAVRPIEVVWHLRALARRRFLRVKVELVKSRAMSVPTVTDIYSGANWLERECYDMFGIRFDGHPDLRRILLWDSYQEGFPLRKDFPLRGRFSRAEQLKLALSANPEARYSMEELHIAEAYHQLPEDMKARLAVDRAANNGMEGGE